MQPTTLPWLGYFALIDYVDIFIFLDDVQFERRSWQQRNKININGEEKIISIPVHNKNKREQLINEVKVNYNNLYPEKFIRNIYQSYSKTKYFRDYFVEIEYILRNNDMLSDLNINLIKYFSKKLNIETKFGVSSKLKIKNIKGKKLFDIAKYYECKKIISPPGSKKYLQEMETKLIKEYFISIEYFNYTHPKYYNNKKSFIPNLSIIDLLFNHGDESLNIIRSGV